MEPPISPQEYAKAWGQTFERTDEASDEWTPLDCYDACCHAPVCRMRHERHGGATYGRDAHDRDVLARLLGCGEDCECFEERPECKPNTDERDALLMALTNYLMVHMYDIGWTEEGAAHIVCKSRHAKDGTEPDGTFTVGINCAMDRDKPDCWVTWRLPDEWWDRFIAPAVGLDLGPTGTMEDFIFAFTSEGA